MRGCQRVAVGLREGERLSESSRRFEGGSCVCVRLSESSRQIKGGFSLPMSRIVFIGILGNNLFARDRRLSNYQDVELTSPLIL